MVAYTIFSILANFVLIIALIVQRAAYDGTATNGSHEGFGRVYHTAGFVLQCIGAFLTAASFALLVKFLAPHFQV